MVSGAGYFEPPIGTFDNGMNEPAKPLKADLIGSHTQRSLTPGSHMQESSARGFLYEYALIMHVAQRAPTAASLAALLTEAETRGLAGQARRHAEGLSGFHG